MILLSRGKAYQRKSCKRQSYGKAGMHKDAVLRDRRINKHTGERNDAIIYSMTKEEL